MPHIPMPSAAWRLMLAIQCEQIMAVTTTTVPADDMLFEVQAETSYAHLGHPLADAAKLIPRARIVDHKFTATRTATGLVRSGQNLSPEVQRTT